MNTVAIIMPFPGVFKVFDSHSRNLYGMPSISGFCVLISVEGVENLTNFFRVSSSPSQNDSIPFELKGVQLIHETPQSNDKITKSVVTNNSQEPTSPTYKGSVPCHVGTPSDEKCLASTSSE